MKKYAVIVAGGSGTRMGANVPKQFLELKGKTILYHTVQAFLKAFDDLHIILVVPENFTDKSAVAEPESLKRISITAGGITRFDSVKNGLALIDKNETSIIFVHDGVRCMVSEALIKRCYEHTLQFTNAVPAVTSQDSIRITSGDKSEVANRNNVYLIQTPQTFLSHILLPAFDQPYRESFTDEATVVESRGHGIHLVEGEYSNIKITRPIDLLIAENLLAEKNR